MPCPASLEERALARLDCSLPELTAQLARRWAQLPLFAEVAAGLEHRSALDDPEGELEQTRRELSSLRPTEPCPVWTGPPAEFRGGVYNPSQEDIERLEAAERWLQALVARVDLVGCVLGCAIARWLARAPLTPEDPLAAKAEAAVAAHRAHRLAERAELLMPLADDSPRRARLQALDERRLMTERRCLFEP